MTSTLLPSSSPRAGDAVTRRTGAAGLAAALAAVAPRWLDLVEYRADGRWTHLLPTNDAADVLDITAPRIEGELRVLGARKEPATETKS